MLKVGHTDPLPMRHRDRALVLEQPALDRFAEGKASQRAIGPYHTVAGNNQADRVRPVGLADRAGGTAEFARDLTVASRLPGGDLLKRSPDPFLKIGPLGGELQGEPGAGRMKVIRDLSPDPGRFRLIADGVCAGQASAERSPVAKRGRNNGAGRIDGHGKWADRSLERSEEHTSEL